MGKHNRTNREAKKRKLDHRRSLKSSLHAKKELNFLPVIARFLQYWSLGVTVVEARLRYLQNSGWRFLMGEIDEADFHFLEEEKPNAWKFLKPLLSLRYIIDPSFGKKDFDQWPGEDDLTFDEHETQYFENMLDMYELAKQRLYSCQISCNHHPSQEQKAQLTPGL